MADQKQDYDVIIIGGGPAGLSAALYAAREGMRTIIFDKGAFGGMAAVTEKIDNYPGFRDGVGGQQLIDEMTSQATRFGAEAAPFTEVSTITPTEQGCRIVTADGIYNAKAVLVATGSEYRKMGIPGEAQLIGRGVHFCATCDGPLYRDKHIVVIGGGNSALQESLFLARFAAKVDILVRGSEFVGSDVLQQAVAAESKIVVQYNASAKSLTKPAIHDPIQVQYEIGTKSAVMKADGVFVFVGLLPNTHGLDNLPHDEKGFLVTNNTYGTTVPGVFVAGDVRSGSTWQIGSAVGEGVSAALAIRHYLDEAFPGWHKK